MPWRSATANANALNEWLPKMRMDRRSNVNFTSNEMRDKVESSLFQVHRLGELYQDNKN